MTILIDSREFHSLDPTETQQQILEMLEPYLEEPGYTIAVQVRARGRERHRKEAVKGMLRRLMRTGPKEWARGPYHFQFDRGVYLWNDREISITAGEALYLYRRFVAGGQWKQQGYFLKNLRRRFGKEFLAEADDV
jgi:hypothetical protein